MTSGDAPTGRMGRTYLPPHIATWATSSTAPNNVRFLGPRASGTVHDECEQID